MLYLYTAQIMAAQAQHRHLDGARLDGRVTDKTSHWRSWVAALFARSNQVSVGARAHLDQVATA